MKENNEAPRKNERTSETSSRSETNSAVERMRDVGYSRESSATALKSENHSLRDSNPDSHSNSLSRTTEAARNGDFGQLQNELQKSLERAKGDPKIMKNLGSQLGENLNNSGVKVDPKDGRSMSFTKDGHSVEFQFHTEIDMAAGKVNYSAQAKSLEGRNPSNFANGYNRQPGSEGERLAKVTDLGNGHTRTEYDNGTSVERKQSGATYTEVHNGPKPEDKFTVKGDDKGNKVTDYGNGHTKTEYANGTSVERKQNGVTYTEVHNGPKPQDKFTVTGDDKNNSVTDYGNGHTRRDYANGTSVERKENGVTYTEVHNGPKPQDKFTVTGDDKNNSVTDYGNGHTRRDYANGTSVERKENGVTYTEVHNGPKPEDKYTVTGDDKNNSVTDYGNGHTRRDYANGTSVERKENGVTYTEVHNGPKSGDKFTVKGDDRGNRVIDYGNGHTRIEYANGTFVENK